MLGWQNNKKFLQLNCAMMCPLFPIMPPVIIFRLIGQLMEQSFPLAHFNGSLSSFAWDRWEVQVCNFLRTLHKKVVSDEGATDTTAPHLMANPCSVLSISLILPGCTCTNTCSLHAIHCSTIFGLVSHFTSYAALTLIAGCPTPCHPVLTCVRSPNLQHQIWSSAFSNLCLCTLDQCALR